MVTIRTCAHIVKSHFCGCFLCVRLKEDRLAVTTSRTRMILRARHRWILNHVHNNVTDLIDFMHDSVDINAARISKLTVVAVPTSVEEHSVLFVLLWVEHVVTFLTEADSDESWSVRSHFPPVIRFTYYP